MFDRVLNTSLIAAAKSWFVTVAAYNLPFIKGIYIMSFVNK